MTTQKSKKNTTPKAPAVPSFADFLQKRLNDNKPTAIAHIESIGDQLTADLKALAEKHKLENAVLVGFYTDKSGTAGITASTNPRNYVKKGMLEEGLRNI